MSSVSRQTFYGRALSEAAHLVARRPSRLTLYAAPPRAQWYAARQRSSLAVRRDSFFSLPIPKKSELTRWPLARVTRGDANEAAQATLRARGFVDDPEHPWMRLNHRMLENIEEPTLLPGYKLRTVADYDGDITKRVAVHQRSWAELGTRVSLDTYPGVIATWPYRSDLDLVLEAEDGTPVAFALGWYDEANRLGEFEPLGTDPDFRNQGLGRALLLLGLRRFREAGATQAIVGSRGDDGHPLPRLLYESVGFRELSRQRWFIRE